MSTQDGMTPSAETPRPLTMSVERERAIRDEVAGGRLLDTDEGIELLAELDATRALLRVPTPRVSPDVERLVRIEHMLGVGWRVVVTRDSESVVMHGQYTGEDEARNEAQAMREWLSAIAAHGTPDTALREEEIVGRILSLPEIDAAFLAVYEPESLAEHPEAERALIRIIIRALGKFL